MKRVLSILLCTALILGIFPSQAKAAPVWPDNIAIQAEGGIVIDAETGTVLFGKNIHEPYYPASITKILTALLVIERCDLDEMVTFSHNAVYNVEAGSSSAALDEGDVLSVRDCLYALLLKSANEAANALAEHVAGTTESFAELMNAKAAALGCQDSHFANPSGLNDPNHYTSAYDMALIGQAALQNETFMEIDSSLYYDLPVTKRNRDGLRIYPGHKMIKKNMPEYYSGALGGKTGYTSLAGNTLVTFASREGMTLVAVVLNGHSTHYSDTKAMLNFGFKHFLTVSAADFDTDFTSVENDLTIAGLSPTGLSGLELDPSKKLTIPKDAVFSSVTSELSYDLGSSDPAGSIARVQYYWNDRKIGFTYLTVKSMSPDQVMLPASVPSLADARRQAQSDAEQEESAAELTGGQEDSEAGIPAASGLVSGETSVDGSSGNAVGTDSLDLTNPDSANTDGTAADSDTSASSDSDHLTRRHPSSIVLEWIASIPISIWLTIGGLVLAVAVSILAIALRRRSHRKEEQARMLRRQRRLERLEESGISSEQFEFLVQQRRSAAAQRRGQLEE